MALGRPAGNSSVAISRSLYEEDCHYYKQAQQYNVRCTLSSDVAFTVGPCLRLASRHPLERIWCEAPRRCVSSVKRRRLRDPIGRSLWISMNYRAYRRADPVPIDSSPSATIPTASSSRGDPLTIHTLPATSSCCAAPCHSAESMHVGLFQADCYRQPRSPSIWIRKVYGSHSFLGFCSVAQLHFPTRSPNTCVRQSKAGA
ncbi:MAG: hypothetical protein JWN11_1400 [Hyphomicrobiales bacterium]|nr:hypothetical protein [Hyphomicrobiales bacterium]